MIRFDSDYLEGATPKILKRIVETNYEQLEGYGKDKYTKEAIECIKKRLKNNNVDIHFLVGGTQTNMIVISSILKSYEAVICANTGHINLHEVGAVESCGNKIISCDSNDGKVHLETLKKLITDYENDEMKEHMVVPKLLCITLPTECGTNYTKRELEELYNYCKSKGLYLYIDGARLGYGLVSKDTDLKFEDISNFCDVFYIGGTKQGALFGEAVVIVNDDLKKNFRYYMKQKGGLLAKGRILGIEFLTLFEDDLYFKLSKVGVSQALKIRKALEDKGYSLYYDSYTNEQFVVIENEKLEELEKEFVFAKWKKMEGKTVVRIVTSWATRDEDVFALIAKL